MSNHADPKWIISDEWAVNTDPYNWILYRLSGNRWRPLGYYRTPELLLESLYRKLLRTETRQPTIEQHVERCLRVVQTAADYFMQCMTTHPPEMLNLLPPAYHTMLKEEVASDAS